jgi:ABC-type Fe3+ transport system permease subunit
MKSNVGNIDKAVRLTLALVIGATGFYFKSWWGLLAILPLVTGLFSFCPAYTILGLNTCSTKSVQ